LVLTGSLWAPICAHAVNNAAATLFTMIELEDGAARVLALTGLVAAISALFVLRQRRAVLPRP
jgi:membrane protease YdiL (CAAX protease family)